MATSNQDREQHINEGLRKLEEFQRRRVQSSQIGHVAVQRPASTAAGSREPITTPVPVVSTSLTPTGSAPTTSVALVSSSSRSPSSCSPSSRTLEFTAKLQALLEPLLSVQAGIGTQSPSSLDELHRQFSELLRESAAAESQRHAMQVKINSLEESYVQAYKTIDLLVGEKSRLKAALEALDYQLFAKTHEVEVYESEVRTLKGKVTTTEGQIEALRAECERAHDSASTSSSNDALVASYKKQIEELGEQQRHAAEKLQQMHRSYEQTRTALESATKELSVAQAYIQQLSGGTENPTTAKAANNDELESLRDEIRTLMSEKSAAELISRNLEASNRGLQDRVAKLSHDFDQLQQMKSAPNPSPTIADPPPSNPSQCVAPLKVSIETQYDLGTGTGIEEQRSESEKEELKAQLEVARMLTGQYYQELTSLQAQMAITGEQLQKAKLDSSRACVQNRELKSQLEELQDVFVRLSNEKLALTEQLDAEKHRAQQLENELRRKETASPDVDISPSQPSESQLVAQWAERYEQLAKQHSTCQENIEKLQSKIAAQCPRPLDESSSGATRDAKVQNESPSVSISEYEFVEQTPDSSVTTPAEHDLDTDNTSTSSRDSTSKSRHTGSHTPVSENELHARFREALQKIETLEEQKSFLEHQVVQLQMETDTISDYVQLYQQQRAALNRRQQDKEAQMNQLLADREELREKVAQLQALVSKLVPAPFVEKFADTKPNVNSDTDESMEISREVLAREIFNTLEDINQASSPVSFEGLKCTSCHGCQGKLISL